MKTAIATLKSISPYSQSKYVQTPDLPKEGKDAKEKRTWRDRLHVTEDGRVFIPRMSFKNCLSESAKYLPMQMNETELEQALIALISEIGASGPQDMGKVMGAATKKLAGKADGRAISEKVKGLLNK